MTGKEILEKMFEAGFTEKDIKSASARLSIMKRWENTSEEDRKKYLAKARAGRFSTHKD